MKKTKIYENVVTGDVVTFEINSKDEDVLEKLKDAMKKYKKRLEFLDSPAFNNIKMWESVNSQK